MSPAQAMLLLRGLDLLILGVQMAPHIKAAFNVISDELAVMIQEGRDPSQAEIAAIHIKALAVHDNIQAAHKEELIGEDFLD